MWGPGVPIGIYQQLPSCILHNTSYTKTFYFQAYLCSEFKLFEILMKFLVKMNISLCFMICLLKTVLTDVIVEEVPDFRPLRMYEAKPARWGRSELSSPVICYQVLWRYPRPRPGRVPGPGPARPSLSGHRASTCWTPPSWAPLDRSHQEQCQIITDCRSLCYKKPIFASTWQSIHVPSGDQTIRRKLSALLKIKWNMPWRLTTVPP